MDIPVVYLTAYGDEKTVERAKLTEPVGYVLKPFDERELRFTIEIGLYKHQVEKRLRDREEQYRQLADHPGEVLWMMDAESGETLYLSPAYEQIWGRPYRDLPATLDHWVQPVHPDDRPKVLEVYNAALAGKQEDRGLEYRIVRPDGSTRWVWSRILPCPQCRRRGVPDSRLLP